MRKDILFEKIGEMTIQFASLEHQLQTLLEILLGEGTGWSGPSSFTSSTCPCC